MKHDFQTILCNMHEITFCDIFFKKRRNERLQVLLKSYASTGNSNKQFWFYGFYNHDRNQIPEDMLMHENFENSLIVKSWIFGLFLGFFL